MVHRWRCRHCDYTVWSASRSAAVEAIESHLLDHHRGRLSKDDFRVSWDCPYCDRTSQNHDKGKGIQHFREHLFGHAEALLEGGTHVADDVKGTGNIMVRSRAGSTGADNARVHFLSPGDILLFVTTTPAKRLRLLEEELSEWPAWTIVLTTKENPLEGVDIPNLADRPLEIVRIDRRLGLADLGETISRVLEEQNSTQGKVSVEFDILSEIIEKFDAQTVFKFLHVLTKRMERANALAHYYVNPQKRSASTVNVLNQLFDMSIEATDDWFVSDPSNQ